jgi:ArsR family transcriptional regulator
VLTHQAPLTDGQLIRSLADPLRLRIVELLAAEQLCTCHLVELTGATSTNLSNHLRVLRDAGVVETEPAGRYTYYRLVPARLAEIARTFEALAAQARLAVAVKRPCG